MILDEIVNKTKIRIAREKEILSPAVLKDQVLAQHSLDRNVRHVRHTFCSSLMKEGLSFICEVKKASPSKGIIDPDFPYLEIAGEYEEAGADAISCLTEPDFFHGSNRYLRDIASRVSIPVLKKDFIIDPYMIYQAKACGASAILLICAILDDRQLAEYLKLAHELGMDALVEAQDREEVSRALAAGAGIIGVNNRDLRTFQVDLGTSIRLRDLVPPECIYVSESGIRDAKDIEKLRNAGVNAVLIGETFMRSPDKKAMLQALRSRL